MDQIPPPGQPPAPPGEAPPPPPPGPPPPAGWLQDPTRSGKQRYWDGVAWTGQVRHANAFKRRLHFSPWWLLGVFVALVVLWGTGVFDEQLVDIGLNARDCYDPVDGEIVCGGEAQDLIEAERAPDFVPPPAPPLPGDPNYPGGFPTTPDPGGIP